MGFYSEHTTVTQQLPLPHRLIHSTLPAMARIQGLPRARLPRFPLRNTHPRIASFNDFFRVARSSVSNHPPPAISSPPPKAEPSAETKERGYPKKSLKLAMRG